MSAFMRSFLLTLLGILVLEALWIAVVPPFRGIDEFDHVYRAAAVADGEWKPDYQLAAVGRGELVTVPRDIVDAAHLVCSRMPYTGRDNCNPVADAGAGRVTVASAAARYNPFFYAAIGTAAKPFSGDTALYAMRAVAALLCAVLVALAVTILRATARTHWPLTALLTAATPMLAYSCSLPAPNGIEMAAALLLWCCLLALSPDEPPIPVTFLLAAATGAGCILATSRTLGPVWFGLIVVTWLMFVGPRFALGLIRAHRRTLLSCLAVLGLAALGAAWWTLSARTNMVPGADAVTDTGSVLPLVPLLVPWWIIQTIGVFPTLIERAPMALYALGLLSYAWFAGVAVRRVRRHWLPIAFLVAVSIAVPMALTILTFRSLGLVWQGRYGMPLTMGIFLLVGYALDASPQRDAHKITVIPRLVLGVSLVAEALALVGTRHRVLQDDPYPDWSAPPTALLIAGVVLAYAVFAVVARTTVDKSRAPRPSLTRTRAPAA